ncbi:TPA: PTS transporter subunit EIIC [Streptococcus suis]
MSSLTHCATRLRFTLVDKSKADQAGLEQLEGVLGVIDKGGQFQVIIGNDVAQVYRPLAEDLEEQVVADQEVSSKQGIFATVLATISGIFTPILPVITAAGMIKAVLSLLTVFGVVAADDTNYQILNFIGDAGFFFLPIFLGGSAARQFKTNQQLGILIGAILLHPSFVALVTAAKEAGTGLNFFSISITIKLLFDRYSGNFSSMVHELCGKSCG